MRVLQIGLGRWGRNHLRTWRSLGVELCVADVREELLAELPEPAAKDFRELLARVDAVDVVTPAPSHHAIVRTCLEAGKDVLVEKPLTLDSTEALELAELADERGAVLHVGHVFRFAPAARKIAEIVRAGRIGNVRYALAHFMGFKRPRSDGGVAVSDAIHFVDLVSWILGKPPTAVTAVLRDYFGREMDDLAILTLHYGAELAHVEAGYFPPEARRDLHVMGTEGAITCDFLAEGTPVRVYGHAHREVGPGEWQAREGEAHAEPVESGLPLTAELEAFLESCRSRCPSPVAADGYAGAAAVAVIEAAERSARDGRTVALKPPQPGDG